jgi:hypothetical protein
MDRWTGYTPRADELRAMENEKSFFQLAGKGQPQGYVEE